MKTLIIEVADRKTANDRFKSAMTGHYQVDYVSFNSIELMHKIMTPRRLEILGRLQTRPVGLRALARELNVDPGNLQRDVKLLKEYGIVQDTKAGLSVPYDKIRLEVVLKAA